jgi:SAM-dependent methyltransferase
MPILSHISSIMEHSFVYMTYQTLVGGIRARRLVLEQYANYKPGMVIIDVGCGPGYPLKWLPGADYYGFDISPQYIESAKQTYGDRGHFYCDLFSTKYLAEIPPADLVILMGVVHHLDDATTQEMFRLAHSALKPEGTLIALELCYKPDQPRIAKFLIDNDRGEYVRTQPEYERLGRQVFSRVRSDVREDLFYIPYTCLVLQCQP